MTSLPVEKCSGDDADVILGASKFKRLSCRSFHLIPIILPKEQDTDLLQTSSLRIRRL